MTIRLAKQEHEVAYKDLHALIAKHADKLTALEVLAIAANMVGKLVALQDQRTVTPEIALRVVSENLEHGNKQIIQELSKNTKGTA